LILSRVQEKDFDELLEVQFKAFSHVDIHQALFGPNTKENRDRVKEAFIKDMHNDVADCWMKLVDETTGRIVSASQWKIYPSWVKPKEHPAFESPFYEGKERKISEKLGNDFYEKRGAWSDHPHVLLYILFTDPDYQRCGAGSIHVKWGTDLADRLLLPAWVEGSPNGHHLYEENGFKDVEHVHDQTDKWLVEYTIMRREPKTHFEAGRSIVFT